MKDDVKTTEFSYLTADIGGTNVRFGVVNRTPESSTRPQILEQKIYPCSSFDSIDVAMETYRQQIGVPLPDTTSAWTTSSANPPPGRLALSTSCHVSRFAQRPP